MGTVMRDWLTAVTDMLHPAQQVTSTASVEGNRDNVTDGATNVQSSISPSVQNGSASGNQEPITTTTYTVESNDTLMSIAARFETTPSELTKLNRLSTRCLFPGQSLLVPLKAPSGSDTTNASLTLPDTDGSISRSCPRTPANSLDTEKSLDSECLQRFLKVRVRHFTDGQGVVGGVLLITPNAVMFDPDVSDPVVLEHGGCDSYGLIAPMECLANIAIYYDIAHMRVKDTKLQRPELPKPDIYYSSTMKRANRAPDITSNETLKPEDGAELAVEVDSPLILSKDATFPELSVASDSGKLGGASSAGSQDDDSSCSCGGETRDSSAFPKAFDHELLTPETYPHSPVPIAALDQQQEFLTSFSPKSSSSVEGISAETFLLSGQPLSTIDENSSSPPGSDAADAVRGQASRNVSCDSAVSVSSELDLIIGGEGSAGDTGGEGACIRPSSSSDQSQTRSAALHQHSSEDAPSQASRKQKVLKRLSNPLSWMDSFSGDASGSGVSSSGSGTPPILGGLSSHGGSHQHLESADPSKQAAGVLSSVFSMTSNVSNMLTSSPKYLADLGSGLFARSPSDPTSHTSDFAADYSYHTQSLSPQPTSPYRQTHAILSGRPSLDLARRTGSSHTSQETTSASAPLTAPAPGEQKRAQFKEGSNVGFRSLVPMDDLSNLFTSVDKIVGKKNSDNEENLLYLCLRMGIGSTPPKSMFISYGTRIVKSEYWFSIPSSKAPDVSELMQLWSKGMYGELDEDKLKERGMSLVVDDIDLTFLEGATGGASRGDIHSDDDGGQQLKEITRESWEKIKAPYTKFYSMVKNQMTISTEAAEVGPMSEELRRALYSSASLTSLDVESLLPEMQNTSEFIDHQTYKNLYRRLPPRFEGYSWRLQFSTGQHGFSLSSLYRKMSEFGDTPVMLCIQDTQQTVFGALISNTIRVSESFYGTGESFLFSSYPSFAVFSWTGENCYFIKGNNESLYIGGGDHFGIWLDGDLYRGRSQPCKTYGNPVLGPSEDFVIKAIECWALM